MTLFYTRHKPLKNSFLYHQLLLLNDTSQIIRPHHGLSHFQNHKFKHSFENTLNQLSLCGLGVKTNTHLLLDHLFISSQRCTLLSTDNDLNLNYIILLHKPSSDTSGNIFKLNGAMNYVITAKIFEEILFCYLVIFYLIFIVFSYFLFSVS